MLQHPSIGVELCRRFASVLAPFAPTLVVGPTTGGVLLSFETARQLGGSARAAFAEPASGGGRSLRRGWPVAPDPPVPVHALGRLEVPSWEAADCPLCADGVPLRKPGSG